MSCFPKIHALTLAHKCTISHTTTQAVSCPIPGLNGTFTRGERLTNIVWYANTFNEELKKILTDTNGVQHTFSLGVGQIRPEIRDQQRNLAPQHLCAPYSEVWQKVESPFIQAITDNLATKCVFMNGEVVLLGDAVAGLRPHTIAGTSQAALHALLLKKVFGEEKEIGIEEWGKLVLEWSTKAQMMGVQLGNLSQFGEHPLADNGEVPN